MSTKSQKQPEQASVLLKLKTFLLFVAEFSVYAFRKYLRLRIWAIVIPLLIVLFMGKLLTKDGLLVIAIILFYLMLSYLDRWFEKRKDK